jgi:hypothetical protein
MCNQKRIEEIKAEPKYITNDIRVFAGFSQCLADNGKAADHRITLNIAPEFGGENIYLYLETNGCPTLVGWLEDGEFVLDASTDEWFDADASEWLRDAVGK